MSLKTNFLVSVSSLLASFSMSYPLWEGLIRKEITRVRDAWMKFKRLGTSPRDVIKTPPLFVVVFTCLMRG